MLDNVVNASIYCNSGAKRKLFQACTPTRGNFGSKAFTDIEEFVGLTGFTREGLVWRVRNRHSIRIWDDKWIPRSSSFCIQSPVKGLDAIARVKELIEIDGGIWKEDLVKASFNEEDSGLVCIILINRAGLLYK